MFSQQGITPQVVKHSDDVDVNHARSMPDLLEELVVAPQGFGASDPEHLLVNVILEIFASEEWHTPG